MLRNEPEEVGVGFFALDDAQDLALDLVEHLFPHAPRDLPQSGPTLLAFPPTFEREASVDHVLLGRREPELEQLLGTWRIHSVSTLRTLKGMQGRLAHLRKVPEKHHRIP